MKVPEEFSVGELPMTGSPGMEPSGKEIRVRREIMQTYIQPLPPPMKTPLPKGRIESNVSQPRKEQMDLKAPLW